MGPGIPLKVFKWDPGWDPFQSLKVGPHNGISLLLYLLYSTWKTEKPFYGKNFPLIVSKS